LALQAHPAQSPAQREHQRHQLETSVPPGFSVAAVGDIINVRPISQVSSFVPVGKLVEHADVAFGNFEGTVVDPHDLPTWVEAETGGGAILMDPLVPPDLKKIGFDLVARANNHAMDLGVVGMRSTTKALEKAGLVQAGVGMSQGTARSPSFIDTPQGRIGLVSATASFTSMSRSGPPIPGQPARPGVNALRTHKYHLVTAAEMRQLEILANESRKVHQEQPVPLPGRPESIGKTASTPESPPEKLDLFGVRYMVSDHHGVHYTMNQSDLREIMLNVEDAKKSSDFVIVSLHAHAPGNYSQTPADFASVFAHDAIDAGADAVVMHGPHQLRGIEIYKGRPVFYSLGNFVFQIDIIQPIEPDIYDEYGFDPRVSSSVDVSEKEDRMDFSSPFMYQSVVATMTFGACGVRKIVLTPIDLHEDSRLADRGVPTLASPTMARTIISRLQALSLPYGTYIGFRRNSGIIRPVPAKTACN
jgi:poly-gamma-glutamate synthesis protein (capsule biosynthesis protein)